MPSEITKETFETVDLDVLHIGGLRWIRGEDIGSALGFRDPGDAVKKILQRNRSEFDETTTITVELKTATGWRATRLYNSRGAALIAMKAQTPKGEAFRRWVLDVLEGAGDTGPVVAGEGIPRIVHNKLNSMFLGARGNPALVRYRGMGLGTAEIGRLLQISSGNVSSRLRVAEFLGLIAIDPTTQGYRETPQYAKFMASKQHREEAKRARVAALAAPIAETSDGE